MNKVAVHTVAIDEANRLRVFVSGSAHSGYAHIYRDASGVAWDENAECLCSDVPRNLKHTDWYRIIVEAVKREYGENLTLSDDVDWANVPQDTQYAIHAIGFESQ